MYEIILRIFNHTLSNIKSLRRRGGVMVFNATFNNISVMSWRSVLLMEE
jgi:hypothetical protein